MLKRTYVNPEDVTRETFLEALHQVRDDLASGLLDAMHFDMTVVRDDLDCGTVCCIGGWCEVYCGIAEKDSALRMSQLTSSGTDPRLFDLFYGYPCPDHHTVTPLEAVAAIDRYFAGDDKIW